MLSYLLTLVVIDGLRCINQDRAIEAALPCPALQ